MKIQLKLQKSPTNIYKPYHLIFINNQEVGELHTVKTQHLLYIKYLYIYPEYQHNHYAQQVIQYLLSHYKINCILGESLPEARTFWHKMINLYNGKRHNVTYSGNTTSSFVIPDYPITNIDIFKIMKENDNE